MTALHELFLSVQAEVEEAVEAVTTAVAATADLAETAIVEARQAVEALSDYLDYFGLVGPGMQQEFDAIVDRLNTLESWLQYFNHTILSRDVHGATAKYTASKQSYDGFTGGWGGQGSGGGAQGNWDPPDHPWYTCHNRNGAVIKALDAGTPPSEDDIDYTVILGPCSPVFVYTADNPSGWWEAGIYQYARMRAWFRFIHQTVIFSGDYGDAPQHADQAHIFPDYVITDSSDEWYCKLAYAESDWGPYGLVPSWPHSTATFIADAAGDVYRDVEWSVAGRYYSEYLGHNYWLYELSYWTVSHQHGILDANGQGIIAGNPDQLKFENPCSETLTPGISNPLPIAWPIIYRALPVAMRARLMRAARIWLILRPYDVMCGGEKMLINGEQITIGDPDGN